MKKLFTLCMIVVAFAGKSYAQIDKGEKMLGLSFAFSTSSSNYESAGYNNDQKNKSHGFQIMPEFGIGLGNHWIVGANAAYIYSKQDYNANTNTGYSKANGLSGGVFVRKFHPIGGDRFGIFGQGNVNYSYTKNTAYNFSTNINSKVNAIEVELAPGLYFKPSKRFIVEAYVGSIAYTHSITKPLNAEPAFQWKSTSNSFSASLTNSLALGFKVVL